MISYLPRLNDAQRDEARRRWEGSAERGFTQLAAECAALWGITISRQALRKAALKGGWSKIERPDVPQVPLPSKAAASPPPRANRRPKVALGVVVAIVVHGPRLRACPPGK